MKNNLIEILWKEEFVTQFEVLAKQLLGKTEEDHYSFLQVNPDSVRD
jgi:hypothetical protein